MELNSIPWNLAVCAGLGVWLMAAPAVLGVTGSAAANDQLVGALVTTFAVIGFGETSRTARWINVPFGLWLAMAPWVLNNDNVSSQWNEVAIGIAIVVLSLRRGRITERYGGWERYIV